MLDSQPLRTKSATFQVWGVRQRRRQEGSSFWSRRYDGATLREVRARNGVGRPPKAQGYPLTPAIAALVQERNDVIPYAAGDVIGAPSLLCAVHAYGSQRAAARALGMNLSTFQRRLKKEIAA